MGAAHLAEALSLAPRPGPDLEWLGTWNAHEVGVIGRRQAMLSPETEVSLFCAHATPLRLGLLVQSPLPWGATDPFAHTPLVDLTHRRLDGRLRVRAVEGAIARSLLVSSVNVLVSLLSDGVIAIDDHHVWLAIAGDPDAEEIRAIATRMTDLSWRLATARVEWEADFETAIAPCWSRLASGAGLAWSPDQSKIEGQVHGATLEARVDGEPCRLYTEIYVEWPSLDRGVKIERTEPRGSIAWEPPPSTDLGALEAAFDRELSGRKSAGTGADALSASVLHGALSIATTGASLTIDDTGLVTRLDRVADDDETMGKLFRGVLAITRGILAPQGPSSLYR